MSGIGAEDPDLIEREPALRTLAQARADVAQGRGRAVLVYGEAGIGKTSLLRTGLGRPLGCASTAPRDIDLRWNVLGAGCDALFSPRPLGPLFDMAPGLGERVRALLFRDGPRNEFLSVLLEQLRSAAQPTALVFEDVHWADAATLDCIKFLGRRLESTRVLLILSYRDDELGDRHPLRTVLGDLPAAQVVRIPLTALSEDGVAELARRHGLVRRGLFGTTRGNPFFVIESLNGDVLPATVRRRRARTCSAPCAGGTLAARPGGDRPLAHGNVAAPTGGGAFGRRPGGRHPLRLDAGSGCLHRVSS